jgi:two-component system sensor histidine kinase PhoQ
VVLQRGERLDTSAPGQGIGLAVAVDILSSYNGELSIHESPLGGARFRILLPAVSV